MHSQHKVRDLGKTTQETELISWLLELAKPYHIDEIVPLETADICVAHWVRLKCEYGCSKYGTSWCCPPETPTPEKTTAILREYKRALLLSGGVKNGQFYRDNQSKRRIQVRMWKGVVALERRLFLAGYYKAFALVSESCALCKQCAYPKPCVFPTFRRPSVESCAIDLFGTLERVGKTFRIAQDLQEEYRNYSLILLK